MVFQEPGQASNKINCGILFWIQTGRMVYEVYPFHNKNKTKNGRGASSRTLLRYQYVERFEKKVISRLSFTNIKSLSNAHSTVICRVHEPFLDRLVKYADFVYQDKNTCCQDQRYKLLKNKENTEFNRIRSDPCSIKPKLPTEEWPRICLLQHGVLVGEWTVKYSSNRTSWNSSICSTLFNLLQIEEGKYVSNFNICSIDECSSFVSCWLWALSYIQVEIHTFKSNTVACDAGAKHTINSIRINNNQHYKHIGDFLQQNRLNK